MEKRFLIPLLFVFGLIFLWSDISSAQSIGRYQLVVSGNQCFKIDTITGKTWKYFTGDEMTERLLLMEKAKPGAKEDFLKSLTPEQRTAVIEGMFQGKFLEVK